MTFKEIKDLVIAEYDRRQLVANVRYKALDDFEDMLKISCPKLTSDVSLFPYQKEIMKKVYEKYKNDQGLKMSSGASSMINEVYNQLQNAGIRLTKYPKK